MPIEAVQGYRYPRHGIAHLSREGQDIEGDEENFIACAYSISKEHGEVIFTAGWNDFTFAADVGWASMLVIKIEHMSDHLGLNFVDIVN